MKLLNFTLKYIMYCLLLIVSNLLSTANALGGNYSPAQKRDSPFIECSLFDEEANVTVLSYKHLWDQGSGIRDAYTIYHAWLIWIIIHQPININNIDKTCDKQFKLTIN